MWDFVVPDDETVATGSDNAVTSVASEFRPDRMGLGCSKEMVQEKISENAKKARLTKLLKRRGFDEDGNCNATNKLFKPAIDDSDDDGLSKSTIVRKKVDPIESSMMNLHASMTESNLTKNQKKRLKQKQKQMQKSLLV